MAGSEAARGEQTRLINSSNHRAVEGCDVRAYSDTGSPAPAHQDDRVCDIQTNNTTDTSEHISCRKYLAPSVDQHPATTEGHSRGHPWRRGLWTSFPHRGVLAVFGCLASTVACIIILLQCDGKPQSDWSVSPTVYVSALTTVTNTLARFAFANGVRINWWRTAIKGTSFGDLHHRWSHADGFWSALLAGRHFNPIALSCIAVTIIVVDQPLMQRAVGVVSVQHTSTVEIGIAIAPEIPWGYTSYQNGRASGQHVMSLPMCSVLNDYNSKAPINPPLSGCLGNCTGFIEAGGLAAQCNSTTAPIRYLTVGIVFKEESPFSVSFELPRSDIFDHHTPPIIANIAYSENSNETSCEAIRTETTCTLASATIRYPVTISQGVIRLGDTSSSSVVSLQPKGTRIEAAVDIGNTYTYWTLGGLYLAADMMFSSNATYRYDGAVGRPISLPDSMSSQFLNMTSPRQDSTVGSWKTQHLTIPVACKSNWTDPTSFIISSLNTMAFMLSISAANFEYRNTSAAPPLRTWPMQETRLVNIYKVDYPYLFASIAITFCLVALIMPTFLGWWELGRSVTLNPIETAKAFEAPLLSGPGSNAPLDELIKAVGKHRIKYGDGGVIEEKTNGVEVVRRHLVFRETDEVTTPRKGFVYH